MKKMLINWLYVLGLVLFGAIAICTFSMFFYLGLAYLIAPTEEMSEAYKLLGGYSVIFLFSGTVFFFLYKKFESHKSKLVNI
jgi:hypothetical protein